MAARARQVYRSGLAPPPVEAEPSIVKEVPSSHELMSEGAVTSAVG